MADTIRDGKGTGSLLQVDSKNRMRTYSVVEDEATYINRVEKQMYSASAGAVKADTAGNYVVYLKNTSEKDLIITSINHRCIEAPGTLSAYIGVTGTPGGTLTDMVPTNRNGGTNNEAECDLKVGTNITGLSGGALVGAVYGKEDDNFVLLHPDGEFILPQNSAIALASDNNTTTHIGGFAIYFRDAED